MKITYNWLKEYINFEESPQQLADKLTDAGFEVEELYPLIQPFSRVVVGKVEQVDKHPDADKLTVCMVSDGTETYQVICGAPNVTSGQIVPFAKVGAELPAGFKIKKAKIRGVVSYGMICSKEELGIEAKSEGIWSFSESYEPGKDVYQILNSNADYVFDFFITPNRADCLSLIGIAREVAAITGNPFKYKDIDFGEDSGNSVDNFIKIHIQDTEGCPRYAARVIRDITITDSPEWMQARLSAIGIRPINNIVDITNYVLMELGQPLHAFDLAEIGGNEINVRTSEKNEKFTTLDDKERVLPENTVMICDGNRSVAIGGIMGGQNSEVSGSTTDILLESAYFNPEYINRSSKKLGLNSEASQRFERGTDPNGVLRALDRAASLMVDLAGATVVKGVADDYPQPFFPGQIEFESWRINRLLGTDFSSEFISETLQRLGLTVENSIATIPTFRVDLKIEVDLAEELGRLVNYANLPTKEVTEITYEAPPSTTEKRLNLVRDAMLGLNLREAFSSSMLKSSEAKLFQQKDLVSILNPISDDMTTMRPSLLAGLLRAISFNINRSTSDIQLFEIGRVFKSFNNSLPDQPHYLAMVLSGNRQPEAWNSTSQPIDFYDIKGYLESFCSKIALDNFQFILYDKSGYYSKDETVSLLVNNKEIGLCGRLKPEVCQYFDIEQPVYAFEIDLDAISELTNFERQYQAVSRFPFSMRDLAFVLDESIPAGDILEAIRKNAGNLLQDLNVFDVFRGESLPAGKKSVAIRMRFQSLDRTLSDKEVDTIFRKIIKLIEKQFDATLRT